MASDRQAALQLLGLPEGASDEEIRQAYKKLSLQWHPDKNHNSSEATHMMQQLNAARGTLAEEEAYEWDEDDDDDYYDYDDDDYDDDDDDYFQPFGNGRMDFGAFMRMFAQMRAAGIVDDEGRFIGPPRFKYKRGSSCCFCPECRRMRRVDDREREIRREAARKQRMQEELEAAQQRAAEEADRHIQLTDPKKSLAWQRGGESRERLIREHFLKQTPSLILHEAQDDELLLLLDVPDVSLLENGRMPPKGVEWEVAYCAAGSIKWTQIMAPKDYDNVIIPKLVPGTGYMVKVRTGVTGSLTWSGSPDWGQWSKPQQYKTTGQQPAAAAAAAAAGKGSKGAAGKGKKKKKNRDAAFAKLTQQQQEDEQESEEQQQQRAGDEVEEQGQSERTVEQQQQQEERSEELVEQRHHEQQEHENVESAAVVVVQESGQQKEQEQQQQAEQKEQQVAAEYEVEQQHLQVVDQQQQEQQHQVDEVGKPADHVVADFVPQQQQADETGSDAGSATNSSSSSSSDSAAVVSAALSNTGEYDTVAEEMMAAAAAELDAALQSSDVCSSSSVAAAAAAAAGDDSGTEDDPLAAAEAAAAAVEAAEAAGLPLPQFKPQKQKHNPAMNAACIYYPFGKCREGNACRFRHDKPVAYAATLAAAAAAAAATAGEEAGGALGISNQQLYVAQLDALMAAAGSSHPWSLQKVREVVDLAQKIVTTKPTPRYQPKPQDDGSFIKPLFITAYDVKTNCYAAWYRDMQQGVSNNTKSVTPDAATIRSRLLSPLEQDTSPLRPAAAAAAAFKPVAAAAVPSMPASAAGGLGSGSSSSAAHAAAAAPSSSSDPSVHHPRHPYPCKWFPLGTCRFGNKCLFVHQQPPKAPPAAAMPPAPAHQAAGGRSGHSYSHIHSSTSSSGSSVIPPTGFCTPQQQKGSAATGVVPYAGFPAPQHQQHQVPQHQKQQQQQHQGKPHHHQQQFQYGKSFTNAPAAIPPSFGQHHHLPPPPNQKQQQQYMSGWPFVQ